MPEQGKAQGVVVVTRLPDPFSAGPGITAYVPSPQHEQNCHYLAAKLEAEPTWVGIAGPAGVGKTLR